MKLKDYIFQQDNDPKHTSGAVRGFFTYHDIEVLEWAPQSPDLNPIEHLWDLIKRRLGSKRFSSIDDLKAAIIEIWNSIPVEVCNVDEKQDKGGVQCQRWLYNLLNIDIPISLLHSIDP